MPEMVLGKSSIAPGITLIFEGAIKDNVSPASVFLPESESDIHIEVLANWNKQAPRGSVEGGFVAYLNVKALIVNQKNKEQITVNLLPHLNLLDNLHYAKNIRLPGKRNDLYTVIFFIEPPKEDSLGMHYDWKKEVGPALIEAHEFEFKDLDFLAIANASRR